MAISLSDSVRVGQQKPLDDKYYNGLAPYTSISEVNSSIASGVRYRGLTVNINGTEYWYKDGITNTDLVEKLAQSNEYYNGLTITDNVVKLGGIISGDTVITSDLSGITSFNITAGSGIFDNGWLGTFDIYQVGAVEIKSKTIDNNKSASLYLSVEESLYELRTSSLIDNFHVSNIYANSTGLGLYYSRNNATSLNADGSITFTISDSGIILSDDSIGHAKRGIQYNADYSADFTINSLPNLGWVTGNTLSLNGTWNNSTMTGNYVLTNPAPGPFDVKEVNFYFSGTTYGINLIATNDPFYYATLRTASHELKLSDEEGFNITTNSEQISINASSPTFSGLVYNDDYVANFLPNSLITKQYVDNATAIDYLPLSGNTPTSLFTGDIYIGTGQTNISNIFTGTGNILINAATYGTGRDIVLQGTDGESNIWLRQNGIDLEYEIGSNAIDFKGIVYNADYSVNYTDRSLVDRAYVEFNYLSLNGGLMNPGGTIEFDATTNVYSSINEYGANFYNDNTNKVSTILSDVISVEGTGNTIQIRESNIRYFDKVTLKYKDLQIGTATVNSTILLPDASGTLALTSDITATKFASSFTPGVVNIPNTIIHGLNSTDIIFQLWDIDTNEAVYAQVNNRQLNSVDVTFNTNPTGMVRIVIHK